jgi:hypothetical protein
MLKYNIKKISSSSRVYYLTFSSDVELASLLTPVSARSDVKLQLDTRVMIMCWLVRPIIYLIDEYGTLVE